MSNPIGLRAMPSPPVISPSCRLANRLGGAGFASPASGASPWSDAANCLLGFPFVLEAQTTFYKGFWCNGSAAGGNYEVGIWAADFTKLVTTGSVAAGSSNVPASAAFASSATPTLPPGLYYAGIAHDATTTNQIMRYNLATTGAAFLQAYGCWRQSGITLGSLAATATPGDMTNVAFPFFGLITRSVFDV